MSNSLLTALKFFVYKVSIYFIAEDFRTHTTKTIKITPSSRKAPVSSSENTDMPLAVSACKLSVSKETHVLHVGQQSNWLVSSRRLRRRWRQLCCAIWLVVVLPARARYWGEEGRKTVGACVRAGVCVCVCVCVPGVQGIKPFRLIQKSILMK